MLAGSPNFSLQEVRNASHSVPWARVQSEPVASNVARTLTMLEGIRATLGHRPVTITSLVRSEGHNADVGGSANSAHLNGYGVDITVAGMTPLEVWNALRPAVRGLKIDQLVYEGDHVHVSSDPRARAEVIDLTGPAKSAPADATAVNQVPNIAPPAGCALELALIALPVVTGLAWALS